MMLMEFNSFISYTESDSKDKHNNDDADRAKPSRAICGCGGGGGGILGKTTMQRAVEYCGPLLQM